MQEINNCIIDKIELNELIVGRDWNCTVSKKDKIGGAPWKPTNYSNLVRVRHPNLRKFTYQSKS